MAKEAPKEDSEVDNTSAAQVSALGFAMTKNLKKTVSSDSPAEIMLK